MRRKEKIMTEIKSTKEIKNMFKLKIQLLPREGFTPTTTESDICTFFIYLDISSYKLMNKEAQDEFHQNFTDLYNKAYGKRKGYSAKHNYNIRKINSIFEENFMPYRLFTDIIGCWILVEDLNEFF